MVAAPKLNQKAKHKGQVKRAIKNLQIALLNRDLDFIYKY
jgi:hypothetical protein